MRLERLTQRRPIGNIIERGVRESLGAATGRNKLFQHTTDFTVARQPRPLNIKLIRTPGSQIGGGVNISGYFVAGLSPVDGGLIYM